ncbi:uncharacterized protein [Typha angustifolia]|uniref:uncharacterized protein n=1 Tax=Typha angustifolia TaxID=59011 RepID=UPI003C2FBA13
MEALRNAVTRVFGSKENVIHLLLLGSFVALGVRSAEQQHQIDELESERSALRAANTGMSTAMWSWRQHLFQLADSSDSSPISLSRLRAIYGEGEPSASDFPLTTEKRDVREDGAEESIPIS